MLLKTDFLGDICKLIETNQSIKMAQCSALTNKLEQCTNRSKENGLCGIHNGCRNRVGPNQYEIEQRGVRHTKEIKEIRERIIGGVDRADVVEFEHRMREYRDAIGVANTTYRADLEVIRARHRRLIEEMGVDPDAEIRNRRQAEREERMRIWREQHDRMAEERLRQNIQRNNLWNEQRVVELAQRWLDNANENNAPPAENRELANFAADRQNVHTAQIVQQTKDIVAKVRTIHVPEAYRWNRDFVSPTIGEIIAQCKLSAHAAAQMFNKYVSDETIYEMDIGIYGKVLDSVWQFVKNSSDKADLCRIMKQEMEDNVGMCAQGNLSRICNILAGYMDGIGSQESVAEKLGRLFPALMEIDDDAERRSRGEAILTENAVPREQWANWLEAL